MRSNAREATGMVLRQALFCAQSTDCFVTEGVRFREALGVPAQKRLKSDAVRRDKGKIILYAHL